MSHTEWQGYCVVCDRVTKHWTIYATHVSEQCRTCYHGQRIRKFSGWD